MYDVIIVGGGPIGMNAAIEFGKRNLEVALIDNTDKLGGQITALYPEKEIVDIPNIDSIKAKDYISKLEKEIHSHPNIQVFLNEKLLSLSSNDNVILKCTSHEFVSSKVIIATGLGAFIPRTMGLQNENICKNILYSLNDPSFLKQKKVLVLGGGDSAIDWTKEISKLSDNVILIHRRKEFRGNIQTLNGIDNIKIMTPYIPYEIVSDGTFLKALVVKNVEDNSLIELPCDYVFVNYGFVSSNEFFNLENIQGGIIVDENMETSLKNVYAIGDIARYENKVRRIAPGLNEIKKLLSIFDNFSK